MIRVTVVSPNPALRVGLRELLADDPNLQVVSEAAELNELDLSERETEVLVLASVSPAQFAPELEAWNAVLLLTDDIAAARLLLSTRVKLWGVISPAATPGRADRRSACAG